MGSASAIFYYLLKLFCLACFLVLPLKKIYWILSSVIN